MFCSGPPNITMTWRHWGVLSGKFQENIGHGEMLGSFFQIFYCIYRLIILLTEMYGIMKLTLNEELKVQTVEVFYDPETFIKACEGRLKPSDLKNGKAVLGDIECPYTNKSFKFRICQ